MYLPMAKVPPIVNLSAEDQAQLVRWKSTQGTPQQVALRCRLVLAAAEGYPDLEIASHHEVNRHTVALWRERVQAKGIGSVWEIQAGRGRKPKYELEKRDALIRATLETKPKGMTHWSCRTMAKAQGVNKRNVHDTMFAALNVLDGKVSGQCSGRHRHQEFLRFLRRLDWDFRGEQELHRVLDNYGTHKDSEVERWLKRHARFVRHCIPTS